MAKLITAVSFFLLMLLLTQTSEAAYLGVGEHQETNIFIEFDANTGVWLSASEGAARGGAYKYSAADGAAAYFQFTGNAFAFYWLKSSTGGTGYMTVTGDSGFTFTNGIAFYNATVLSAYVIVDNLPVDNYTVEIGRYTGFISFDSVIVATSPVSTPYPTATPGPEATLEVQIEVTVEVVEATPAWRDELLITDPNGNQHVAAIEYSVNGGDVALGVLLAVIAITLLFSLILQIRK